MNIPQRSLPLRLAVHEVIKPVDEIANGLLTTKTGVGRVFRFRH